MTCLEIKKIKIIIDGWMDRCIEKERDGWMMDGSIDRERERWMDEG